MLDRPLLPRVRRRARATARRASRALRMQRLRVRTALSGPGGEVEVYGFRIRILDPGNARVMAKDIFEKHIYGFSSPLAQPLVIDGGSNIGMSVLYFKHRYPNAHITAIEPDPEVFAILEENVRRNRLEHVELLQAAVAGRTGVSEFVTAHDYDGTLREYADAATRAGRSTHVPLVRLRDLLEHEVDFVKLNVEGAELEVLRDAADRLHNVKELVVEYHHEPGLDRSLHEILRILHDAGFEYLVNSMDETSSPGAHPPFRLEPDSRYYLLVYGRRTAA